MCSIRGTLLCAGVDDESPINRKMQNAALCRITKTNNVLDGSCDHTLLLYTETFCLSRCPPSSLRALLVMPMAVSATAVLDSPNDDMRYRKITFERMILRTSSFYRRILEFNYGIACTSSAAVCT